MTEPQQTEQRGAVIVGVDGSAGASAALMWAAADARLGGSVEVLPRTGISDLHAPCPVVTVHAPKHAVDHHNAGATSGAAA
jgi:hypothetical protein